MEKLNKKINNEEIHNCPLRAQVIDNFDCLKTVQATKGFEDKDFKERLFKEYPDCKKICENCEYNNMDKNGFTIIINI